MPLPSIATLRFVPIGALLAVFRFKVGMLPVLAACSALGVLYGLVTGSI